VNRSWADHLFGRKQPEPWTGFPLPPTDIKTFHDVRALVPDVLPPASPRAQREAMCILRNGSLSEMNIHPSIAANLAAVTRAFIICYRSDLPGFVVAPVLAFLLDQWCVENEYGL